MTNHTDIFMAAEKVARATGAWNEKTLTDRLKESEHATEADIIEFAELLGKFEELDPEVGASYFDILVRNGLVFVSKIIYDALIEETEKSLKETEKRIKEAEKDLEETERHPQKPKADLSGEGAFADIFEAFFGDGSGDLADAFFGAAGESTPTSTPRRKLYSTQKDGGRAKGYAPWNPQKKTKQILAQVQAVLETYEAELPITVRQIFYRLVGAYGYPKTESAYNSLKDYLVRARRAGVVEFDDIRDDGASVIEEKHYAGEEDFYRYVHDEAKAYKRDKLSRQKRDIRVYCEAAGMMPQLRKVTRRYSVPVFSCGGFDSVTAKHDLASAITEAFTYRGRPTVILHLGDHDASGETMFDAISEDVYAFLEVDTPQKPPHEVAIFRRVALTPEQIAEHDLPTDPAKESSHSKKRPPGRRDCQLEALAPDVLARILAGTIEEYLDLDVLKADRETEVEERQKIAKALPAPQNEDG